MEASHDKGQRERPTNQRAVPRVGGVHRHLSKYRTSESRGMSRYNSSLWAALPIRLGRSGQGPVAVCGWGHLPQFINVDW